MATGENFIIGARSAGIAHSSVAIMDVWAVQNNPACMVDINKITAGLYYENRFLVKELSLKSFVVAFPANFGVIGASFNYFGFNLFNESKIGLAYARKFGERFSAGLQLDYLSTRIGENYGNKSLVTFDIGVCSKINDKLTIAAHIFNPVNARISKAYDERVPAIVKIGTAYFISDDLLISFEADKNIDNPPVIKTGIEYLLMKKVYLRTGISTNPFVNFFGVGFNYKKFTVDFSSSIHQVLGFSSQLSLIYKFK